MKGRTVLVCGIALVVIQCIAAGTHDYCPKVSCLKRASKDEGCIETSYDKESKLNIISLKRCYRKDRCQYDLTEVFRTDRDLVDKNDPFIIGVCKRKEERRSDTVYPGESCTADADCIKGDYKSACESNICTGIKSGEECKNELGCISGHYCRFDAAKSTCQPQKKNDESCDSTVECENNLACDGTKCVQLFSVKNGVSVKSDNNYLACESGYVYGDQSQCADLANAKDTITDNGVQFCKTPGSTNECKYTLTLDTKTSETTKECLCSFTKNGGVCPFSNEEANKQRISQWREILKTPSKCHTSNRFNCQDFDKTPDWIKAKSQANPQLYGADEACAPNVVSSSSYLVLSMSLILAMLFL